jgi:hypothetical protein
MEIATQEGELESVLGLVPHSIRDGAVFLLSRIFINGKMSLFN